MKIIFLGSGNLATRLSLEMHRKGMQIGQVYSHTPENAQQLAALLGCPWTTDPETVDTDADLYVFSLKDTVLADVIARVRPNEGLWVHTAGSMPMDVFNGHTANYGVLYPMQTFSKTREVDFNVIPFFLEANTSENAGKLQHLAEKLSGNIHFPILGLIENMSYVACPDCGKKINVFGESHIDETAAKIHTMPPRVAQTGPAIRYDENVINKHLAMLGDSDMRSIYRLISQSIHKEAQHE